MTNNTEITIVEAKELAARRAGRRIKLDGGESTRLLAWVKDILQADYNLAASLRRVLTREQSARTLASDLGLEIEDSRDLCAEAGWPTP